MGLAIRYSCSGFENLQNLLENEINRLRLENCCWITEEARQMYFCFFADD